MQLEVLENIIQDLVNEGYEVSEIKKDLAPYLSRDGVQMRKERKTPFYAQIRLTNF